MPVMIEIADEVYEHIKKIAANTGHDIEEILVRMTRLSRQMLNEYDAIPYDLLSDEQVLALAQSKMDLSHAQWLSELLEKNGEGLLNTDEQIDIDVLLDISDAGNLRKVKALSEAIERGLIESDE